MIPISTITIKVSCPNLSMIFRCSSCVAGIGTYDINEKTVHKSWYGEMCSSISQTIDQGIGTTFDAHVMAGYRFLMRYYDSVRYIPDTLHSRCPLMNLVG